MTKPSWGSVKETPEPGFEMQMNKQFRNSGFGRIGRLVLRSIVEHGRRDIEVVAINDLGPVATNAHLLKYDSVHGRFPGTIESGEDWIDVGLGKIKVTAERDPANLAGAELAPIRYLLRASAGISQRVRGADPP